MNVVFFYQHFWPDSPPYASLLRTIGESLQSEGVDVHVLTGHPSYKQVDRQTKVPSKESMNGVGVQRLRSINGLERFAILRTLQKLLFPIRAMVSLLIRRYVLRKKIDVIIAATIPPVLNGGFAWLTARLVGAKFIYHLQDIYPEIGATSGLWKEGALIARGMKILDTFVCKRASRCIVLSADMKASLVRRGISEESIVVINNFLLDSHQKHENNRVNQIPIANDSINLVFAGNLGKFQGLDHVLDGFIHWQNDNSNSPGKELILHFLGEGSEKARLEKKAGDNTYIRFHDHRPFMEAAQFIKLCDAGIVSLNRDVYHYAFPSKILTYLGLGVPLFALVESESEIARELLDNKLGTVCGSQAPAHVAEAFEEFYKSASNEEFDRISILNHYESNLAGVVALRKWTELVSTVTANTKQDVVSL